MLNIKPNILPCKLKLGGGVTHSLGCIIGFVEDSMMAIHILCKPNFSQF